MVVWFYARDKFTAPSDLKNVIRLKSGLKWLKNNHHSLQVQIRIFSFNESSSLIFTHARAINYFIWSFSSIIFFSASKRALKTLTLITWNFISFFSEFEICIFDDFVWHEFEIPNRHLPSLSLTYHCFKNILRLLKRKFEKLQI